MDTGGLCELDLCQDPICYLALTGPHSNRGLCWVFWDQCQLRPHVKLLFQSGYCLFPVYGHLSEWPQVPLGKDSGDHHSTYLS